MTVSPVARLACGWCLTSQRCVPDKPGQCATPDEHITSNVTRCARRPRPRGPAARGGSRNRSEAAYATACGVTGAGPGCA